MQTKWKFVARYYVRILNNMTISLVMEGGDLVANDLMYLVRTVEMPVKLYKMDPSPPARAAMMACEIFNVHTEFIDVNLVENEHRKPEFLKKNPLHSVPVLEDGDLILHDSHAIMMYLADTYGKDDTFYPTDIKKRALVNQQLYFEGTILFGRLRNVTYEAIIEGNRKVTQKKLNDIKEAYDFLEEFLSRSKYLATDSITIADISAYATVTSLVFIVPLDAEKYPKITAWMAELKRQPYTVKHNAPGEAALGAFIEDILEY